MSCRYLLVLLHIFLFEELILRHTNIKELVLEEEKVVLKFKIEIDTKMDDGLLSEGYSREMMRRIQDLRKKAKLNKEDRIILGIKDNEEILKKFEKEIKERVGAEKIEISKKLKEDYEFKDSFKIKEKNFEIGLSRR